MPTIHLRFTDGRTKQPLPVRLHIHDEAGATYAPFGRQPVFPCGRGEAVGGHLRVGKTNYSLIDGACEIRLPAGVPLTIEAFHGPEFAPFTRTVTLGPGQMALRFEMMPWFDRAAAGLLSGDSRSHFVTPHDALLEAGTEGLDVVNLLAHDAPLHAEDGNTYRTTVNLPAFSGQTSTLERDGRAVAVNTLNAHPMLGRLALLHAHRPIFPLAFGGDEYDDWSLWDWCQQCHRKNGLTVWVNAFRPDAGLMGGEALAACLLGQIDAIEIDPAPRSQALLPWVYRLWNAGVRVPLVGGSGKASNRMPLGAVRTYAALNDGEPRTMPSWIEAVRGGRSFVSNGPIIHTKDLDIMAESAFPFERVEFVANGKVVLTRNAEVRDGRWRGEARFPGLSEPGWWAVRCVGGEGSPLFPDMPAFAHTSPMPLRGGSKVEDPAGRAALRNCLETTGEWVQSEGRFAEDRFRAAILERCTTAAAVVG